MKIFICGGSGYLGGIIANELCKKHTVTIGTRKKKINSKFSKKVLISKVDYLKKNVLNEVFKDQDVVIHLVGMNKVSSNKNPNRSLELKKKSTINITESVIKNNCKLIYFSSIQVYKNFSSKKNINENSRISISDNYSKGHIIAENILKSYKKKFSNIIILRLSSVFGVRLFNDSKELIYTLGNNFCYQAINKKKITVQSPNTIRNFLPSRILIESIELLISKKLKKNFIFNVGYKSLCLGELAYMIQGLLKNKYKLNCLVKFRDIYIKPKKILFYKSRLKNFKYSERNMNTEFFKLLNFFKEKHV